MKPRICSLSREAGEGRGGGLRQVEKNGLDHAIEISIDFIIGDAKNTPTILPEPRVSTSIVSNFFVRRMRGAIDFDYEMRRMTQEICDIRPAWNLPAKMHSCQAMRPQRAP
jgi:hypothetical protein